ncbi:MAG: hypothetical protein RI957_287 [Verrucomicrobiota bacterium]|jgi:hypothetical protein
MQRRRFGLLEPSQLFVRGRTGKKEQSYLQVIASPKLSGDDSTPSKDYGLSLFALAMSDLRIIVGLCDL